MDINYDDYLDNGTSYILEVLSTYDIGEEERSAIVSAFADELANNIGNANNLKDYKLLIYGASIKYIDGKLDEALTGIGISYLDYENAIKLCKRQQELVQIFSDNGWNLPQISNTELKNCEDLLKKRQMSGSISDKIIEEDQRIDELMRQAQAEFSVEFCDLVLELLDILNTDIELCKKKKITLPEINNKNIKKVEKKVSDIRKIAEQKEILHQNICEVDLQIDGIVGLQKTVPEQWQEIINLCQEQMGLLSECSKKRWPLPALKYNIPSELINQYKHYQNMLSLDKMISSNRDALSTRKQYKSFLDNCDQQKRNIGTCQSNNWDMPDLEVMDPAGLSKLVREERRNSEKVKRNKYMFTLGVAVIMMVVSIGCFVTYKFREGKVKIPFDASYVSGKSLNTIYDELNNAGFEKIVKNQDTSGWQDSDEVLSVTIDNLDHYKKGSFKKTDVSVIITYSSSGRIYATDLLKDWKEMDYRNLIDTLNKAGFTNINTKRVDTLDKQQDQLPSLLELNGIDYTNEHCYLPLNAPIVISYYSLKIGIGNDNNEFIGQNHETVVKSLTERGFTNVQEEVINTGFAKGNTVVGVTVNNVDTYDSGETFEPDVQIVVKYSSNDRVDATKCLENWKSEDYEKILANLKNEGFNNVTIQEKVTNDKAMNRLVSSITINNETFQAGECCVRKGSAIIIDYYVLNISVGQTASSIMNNKELEYIEVVNRLKDLGFTNISLQRTNDLINGWITKEGSLDSITINGESGFSETDSFRYDVPIVIVVHTFEGRGCDDITIVAD